MGALAGAALVLGLAACGGDSGSRPPTWFSQGEQTSRDDGGKGGADARAFMVQVTDAQAAVQTVTMDLRMSLEGEELVGQAQTRTGDDPTDVDMVMTMEMPGLGTMEMRLIDQVLYLSLGIESDGKFVRIDADDEMFGEQFDLMLEQMDPRVQMAMMKDAVLDYRQEGDPETIDGVEATPYVVVMDTEAVMEASGAPAEDLEGVPLPDTLESTIFVGPDDLPRRLVMDMIGVEMTMDFSGWGEPVVIEAPPADQILEGGFEDLFSDQA
ncbi:hypothetical protein GCM10009710_14840 [Aeromicrobium alkaliterrae]|uniref:LppX_LprAFG lipoprotein n=2 Tax=Aeromicrobium alkaliterrae TaxID=302168 RepID=A0ABN2JQI4_9ACTN